MNDRMLDPTDPGVPVPDAKLALLRDRVQRFSRAAPYDPLTYFCGHCGEHSDGDLIEAYDVDGQFVAALHIDTCRPSYPQLITDYD